MCIRDRAGTVVVHAHETAHDADGYRYDLRVEDLAGTVLETWDGLRLKDVGPLPRDPRAPWPEELLGPYLTRSLDRLLPEAETETEAGTRTGSGIDLLATDGRLPAGAGFVSTAHLRDRALVAVADRPVAVDWAPVADRLPDHWRALLGGPRAAAVADEPPRHAWSRLLTARQAVLKLGARPDAPPCVERGTEDGWVLLRWGDLRVATVVVSVAGLPDPVAVAICPGVPTGAAGRTVAAPTTSTRNGTPS